MCKQAVQTPRYFLAISCQSPRHGDESSPEAW